MMKVFKKTICFGVAFFSFATISQVVASNQNIENSPSVLKAGLHIKSEDIKYSFSRHLVRFTGDCPGKVWSGIAQNGDLRFIDNKVTPAKKLKVDLINQRTGKKITRKYYKPRLGSNDFNLTQLGNADGKHNVDYTIYHSKTNEVVFKGSFFYRVSSTRETQVRKATWERELYCASDRDAKISECKKVKARMVKYCNGRKTGVSKEDYTYIHRQKPSYNDPTKKKCP